MSKSEVLSFRFNPKDAEKLRAIARERGCSYSDVIKAAVAQIVRPTFSIDLTKNENRTLTDINLSTSPTRTGALKSKTPLPDPKTRRGARVFRGRKALLADAIIC